MVLRYTRNNLTQQIRMYICTYVAFIVENVRSEQTKWKKKGRKDFFRNKRGVQKASTNSATNVSILTFIWLFTFDA